MKRHPVALNLSVILALGLSACVPNADPTAPPASPTVVTLPTTAPTALPATEVPAPTETAAPATGLQIDQLRNAAYRFLYGPEEPVQLTDGVQPRDVSDPAGADYRIASIATVGEALALGDLNGDGADDAAVILTVDPDGTGVFYHLFVVLSDGGAPAQAAEAFLGDRVALQSLTIESGEIIVQMNVAGPEDGACCPSQPSLRRYRLETDLSLSVTLAENGLQVTYPLDYGGEALGYAVAAQPATPWTPTGDDAPAEFGLHLPVFGQAVGVPNDTPFGARIRVYPVRSFAYYGYDEELALLQALLAEPNPDLSVYSAVPSADLSPRLPYLPTANASQVFRAQPALIGFGGERGGSEGGRGVRYLTHYAQGFVPLTRREVWYTYQGLTEDGSYYLSVTFPIRIEDLEETAPLTFDPPDFLAYLQERFQVVQNAGNIQPSLSLLDSIVNTIAITADPIPAQVITIDSPADGTQGVQSGAIMKGTASIWPFEATLVYEVHDGNGNLIGQGPINTVGDIPGPVTFEAPITFTPTEAGLGWIDVLDLSAKDGSVVGADRIEVQLVP